MGEIIKFEKGRVIDISHYQRISSLDGLLNGGVIAVIHKATEGMGNVDAKYANRRAAWKGLFGSYHFLRCYGKISGDQEAEFFLDHVKPLPGELIALDAEAQNLTLDDLISHSEEFVQKIYLETGRYPYFYINNFNLNQACELGYITEDSVLRKCKLWIARYGKQPNVPTEFWDHWTLHQYTDSERDECITEADGDHFYSDTEALYNEWASGSTENPSPGLGTPA